MANIDLNALSTSKLSKPLAEATDQEIYGLLLDEVRERCAAMPLNEGKRKLYYISAEFLIGKLLSNNLIDLGSLTTCASSSPTPATTSARSRSSRSSPPSATAASGAWPRASSTPSPRSACPATAWA